MARILPVLALLALAASPAGSQEPYGSKGIFPVYEAGGEWLIFDKGPSRPKGLGRGSRLLLVGSQGAGLFAVFRSSSAYGGACRNRSPLKLRAALLKGPRRAVGRPIIAIRVPKSFSLKGSRAVYRKLTSEVGETAYQRLGQTLREASLEEARAGAFPFGPQDEGTRGPDPGETLHFKIDFGSRLGVQGLKDPFVFVEETQISNSSRRCLRLAEGERLVGGCAEMPRSLMAETALLEFVAYDPSGMGNPFLLAFTRTQPLWGDERWGFVVRAGGPRLFLMDSMDIRCREGF